MKKITLVIIALVIVNSASAQLTVSGALTPQQWVQNVLLGSGITVSNVTYTGAAIASGTFNGVASNIGFNSGVLLTCGSINNAPGPNNQTSATQNNNLTGDVDLDQIMSPYASHDASILQFDFVSVSDSVKFQYVFASEEYMVYANGSINDGFGFFLSGPGITGPYSSNSVNIALLPGTSTPVTINNVNLTNNGQYYFDNGNGAGSGTAPDGATVQYNGFTVPLTARYPVTCGQTYHIKIAIADGSDWILDSGVFLKAGSFSSSAVQILPQISYGGPTDSVLYEGCGTACIHFIRQTNNLSQADTVNVAITGTATNGVDYNTGVVGVPLPTQLIFQPGQDTISYCINAVADAVIEGLETVHFTISQQGLCSMITSSATLYIDEHSPIQLTMSSDTAFCNTGTGGSLTLHAYPTGGVQPYNFSWTNSTSTAANPLVFVNSSTTFIVSVNDACGGSPDPTPAVTDSIHVNVLNIPSVTVTINPVITYLGNPSTVLYEGCGNACIDFTRTSSTTLADTLTITFGGVAQNGIDYYYNTPGTPMPTQLIFPAGQSTVSYCINAVSDGLTEGLESINLSIFQSNPCVTSNTTGSFAINDLTPLHLTVSNDTTFCSSGVTPLMLHSTVTGGVAPYTYSWTNGAPPFANPVVYPNTPTTYVVTVNDACTATPADPTPAVIDSIRAIILPTTNINISYTMSPDTPPVLNDTILYRGCDTACLHFTRTTSTAYADTVNLIAGGTAINGVDYYYNIVGTPLPSQVIFPVGVSIVNYCISGTINSAVTTAENIAISVSPLRPTVCFTSTATGFALDQHPPLSLTTSGGTTLCNQGGQVTLHALVTGGSPLYTYSWTNGVPSQPNPTVNVTTTTTYVVTINDECAGSPDPTPAVTDSVTVNVISIGNFTISAGKDVTVCPGDLVNLTTTETGGALPIIYNWSNYSGPDSLTSYVDTTTSLTPTTSNIYIITVRDHCNNIRHDTVKVNADISCELKFPNVITPDGQGVSVNEFFYITNLERFPNSSLTIYNRWGTKIYETSNYLNDWSGSKYSDGTYYYILSVPDGRNFNSFFQIIREK